MLELYGAFCYSNQQTDWAYDLGRELLDNFDSIWGYLFGDGDFPDLSLSAGNLIKSANLFVGLGGMFVVEGAELTGTLTDLGALVGSLGMGSLASACLITLPIIFFYSMEPVGGPDENQKISEFYQSHNYDDNPDIIQIKSSKEWIKELKNIQTGEDIPKNGDINLLDGTDGDPENLFKALLIVSSFTGLLIIEDVNVNNGYAYNDNNGGLNSTPANFTLDVNYNKSEGKMTLTKA